jgi:hypothetical protein
MNEDELDFNPEEYENELKPGVVRLGGSARIQLLTL